MRLLTLVIEVKKKQVTISVNGSKSNKFPSGSEQFHLADCRPVAWALPPATVRACDAAHGGVAPFRLRVGTD